MSDPRASRRLRLALTVLLLFVSQLTAFTTNITAMCAPSDCDQEQTAQSAGISALTGFPATTAPAAIGASATAGIFSIADISADSPLNPADQAQGCHTGASGCSLVSPGVPVFADGVPTLPGAPRSLISDGMLPPNVYAAPPHRPPRGYTFPVAMATDDSRRRFGASGVPTSYLIDQQGTIRQTIFGVLHEADPQSSVEALLGSGSTSE